MLTVAVGGVARAGEIAASDRSGDGGWRQGCDGHELSSPIDGMGHSRGWQPGSKVSRGRGSVGGSGLLREYAVAFNKLVIAAHDDQAHVVDFRTLQEAAVEQPVDLRTGDAAVSTEISDRGRDDVVADCRFSTS